MKWQPGVSLDDLPVHDDDLPAFSNQSFDVPSAQHPLFHVLESLLHPERGCVRITDRFGFGREIQWCNNRTGEERCVWLGDKPPVRVAFVSERVLVESLGDMLCCRSQESSSDRTLEEQPGGGP